MTTLNSNAESDVFLSVQDRIATITLNRLNAINALSEEVLASLISLLKVIAADTSVRVVIIRSSGQHFSAGHDLKEMNERRSDLNEERTYYHELFATCSEMMMAIVNLPQPVIAEVQGIATAAGCQLVASCDLAVASEDARFATSGIKVGLFCSTPMVAISRAVPRKAAMEMLLLGEFVDAKQAQSWGLVNRVVPPSEIASTTNKIARSIAQKSPSAIRLGKAGFNKQLEMSLEDAYRLTSEMMAENMMEPDTKAGINAFNDKNPMPDW